MTPTARAPTPRFRIGRTKRAAALALSGILILSSMAMGAADVSKAGRPMDSARDRGRALVARLATLAPEQIHGMTLGWQVRMDCRLGIQLWMSLKVRLERRDGGMVATLHLTEPEGKDAWSWLLLNLIGRHTREYRELVKGIEVRIRERFHREGNRFVTDSLEEALPDELDYANQTAILVRFIPEAGLIRFWPDKKAAAFSESMPLAGQVGPLTAFFNYLFFTPPRTRMRIVNALKQVVDDPDDPDRKQVAYLFESETADLGRNGTGAGKDFAMALNLKKGNFLDILYGKHIFFQLAESPGGPAKVPYAVHVEGIISKNRKARRLSALQKKRPGTKIGKEALYESMDEILAARNVHGYLTGFDIRTSPFDGGAAPLR